METEKKKRLLILLVLYLSYTSIYIARVNLSIASPAFIKQNILDSAQIGMLGSCFFCVYALGRIVNGTLSDRQPPWRMLTIGLLVSGLSNLVMSFLPPYTAMLLFWMTNAYAQSMLWSSVLCVVTAVCRQDMAKKVTSVMVSSVAVGNLLGIVVNTGLIEAFQVNAAFLVPGIVTLLFGVLTFRMTRKVKTEAVTEKEHHSVFTLLKNKEILMINATAMIHGVMKENISLWMAVYIVDTYLVDLTTSSYYILVIPMIGLAGRILYPFLFQLCKEKEHQVSLISFAVCAGASLLLCMGRTGIVLSVLALGVIYMAVSLINTSLLSIYPLRYAKNGNTASVSGIMDFSTYFGAGISSAVYGIVIKYFGYLPMFLSWVILSGISLAVLFKHVKD